MRSIWRVPQPRSARADGMLYRFLFPIVNWVTRVIAHVEVSGTAHMPRGGVLVVSNHLTNYDPLFIGMCFKRELHFMAKAELFRNPVLARIIDGLNAFPVRRDEADRAALRQAEELLKSGRAVAIFPEGHRSRAAAVQQGKGGIALLARRAGAPILPVAITGTEHFGPAGATALAAVAPPDRDDHRRRTVHVAARGRPRRLRRPR